MQATLCGCQRLPERLSQATLAPCSASSRRQQHVIKSHRPVHFQSTTAEAASRTRCECSDLPDQSPAARLKLKAAAAVTSCLLLSQGPTVQAFELPFPGGPPMEPSTYEQREKAFQEGDFLRGLKDKTTSNRAKNKKELQDKYCYRQAELGVGDCAGLRLIPGATKSGKQKTPEWLQAILGGGKKQEAQKSVSTGSAGSDAVPLADEE